MNTSKVVSEACERGTLPFTAAEFLKQANVQVNETSLSDGSKVFNLHIGDREFPCYSERHAYDAAMQIAVALANNSNGPRFDYSEE